MTPRHRSRQYISPFVHNGRWFVRPYEGAATAASLRRILDALLKRFRPADILLLRPMRPEEVRLLEEYRDDSEAEVLSRLVVADEMSQTKNHRS